MPTPIPSSEHRVTLEQALDMVRRYRQAPPAGPTPTLVYHRLAYDRILSQPGCVGIRAYPALHEDGRQTVVLIGVDEKGADMTAELVQEGEDCPPICDEGSALFLAR